MLAHLLISLLSLIAFARPAATPELARPSFIKLDTYMVFGKLPDGSLMAVLDSSADGQQAAASRISHDNGHTWSEPKTLFKLPKSAGQWGLHNMLVGNDGEIHLFYQNDDGTGKNGSIYKIQYNVYHVRSMQGRTTWSQPNLVSKGYYGSMLSSLQMKSGRLILPVCYLTPRVWSNRGTGFDAFTDMGRFSSSVFYSDDQGDTWHGSPVEWKVPSPIIGADGIIEPIGLQLKDGRGWMLLRTQLGRFFESFSADGANWTPPTPTSILASDSPPGLVRLPDGRIVMLWNHCQRFAYANGGRHVLHAAFSTDEGRTWQGCREVTRNPYVNDPPPPNGDHGVSYTVPTVTADGHILTSISVGGTGGVYLFTLDPAWLAETRASANFDSEWNEWSVFGTKGVEAVPDPDKPEKKVLQLRKAARDWPAGAVWNFPAGNKGRLEMRFRVPPGFGGVRIGLTDHFSVPFDPEDAYFNLYNLTLGPDGKLPTEGSLEPNRWHTLRFDWDCSRRSCQVALDGKRLTTLEQTRPTDMGVNYIRLISTATEPDSAGLLVESVETSVSRGG